MTIHNQTIYDPNLNFCMLENICASPYVTSGNILTNIRLLYEAPSIQELHDEMISI